MDDHALPPPLRLGYAVGILGQLFQTRVARVLAGADMTYSQFTALSHLARTGEATVGEIAEAIEINQPGVTKIVQRLGERGLLAVESDPDDGRRRLVVVTDRGRAVLGTCLDGLADDLDGWFDGWTPQELATFTELAERLAGWLDANRI